MSNQEFLLSKRFALFAFAAAFIAITAVGAPPDSYVFRDNDVTWMLGKGMSADALKDIQSRYGREFVWARRNGHVYVSRDEVLLDQARASVAGNLSRAEQERRLSRAVDTAIRRGVARPAD